MPHVYGNDRFGLYVVHPYGEGMCEEDIREVFKWVVHFTPYGKDKGAITCKRIKELLVEAIEEECEADLARRDWMVE